uniref:Peptide synthetase n=1 Tax=Podospora anserina (strain S / ATCC MYA-4624 / DSM 980 / FGSC 10383) TaxID=515849 RepID=A0A090CQZ4_PODAN|nr:Putative peptide synthetase [Podospora anserina S mat+]
MLSPTVLVDRLAVDKPNDVWAKTPATSFQGEAGWEDITFSLLKNAVDATSDFIVRKFGPGETEEVLAYMGINDIRYPFVILGALKAGYRTLSPSPRNSKEGNLALLKTTKCSKFLCSGEFFSHIAKLSTSMPSLQMLQIPTVDELLMPFTPASTTPKGRASYSDHETLIILHTSGTTGLPKPIHIKAGVFSTFETITSIPTPPGRTSTHCSLLLTRLVLSVTPFFHIFGINFLLRALHYQKPIVLLPADKPPTAELILECIVKTKPSALASAPSMIEDICRLPTGLSVLSTLDFVFYGGAPLAEACGNQISEVTSLYNGIGSTEAFFMPTLRLKDPKDWQYFEWNLEAGMVMEPTEENPNLAEAVIKRRPDGKYQFAFWNFPELQEWRTHDLFEEHPTKKGLWKFVGRLDDIIVLSNGEKVNPVAFEKIVDGHPWVQGALMLGAGHFQAGILIEPSKDHQGDDKEEFIDKIWPLIEEANAEYPAYARVWRSTIMLTKPEKPFKRASKGSMMRQATCKLYETEIEQLYKTQEMAVEESDAAGQSNEDVQELVRKTVRSVLGSRAARLTDDANIFQLGADSLQALQLSRILTSSRLKCNAKTVYDNPTVVQLAKAVSASKKDQSPENAVSREERMSAMIYRHSRFPKLVSPPSPPKSPPATFNVLLIGSTGSLGSYILKELLDTPDISQIFCLNRSVSARERQQKSFDDRGLGSISPSRVQYFTGETSAPNFGLEFPHDFASLQQQTDMIIINAWPVNFNSPLEAFEPVIAGTKQCADFSSGSPRKPHIVFISSVASILNWAAVRHIPEDGSEIIIGEDWDPDNSLPAKQGYGESKHVAASILSNALHAGHINSVAVLRVGQLAGAAEKSGVWNRQEWLPSLLKTSTATLHLPSSLPSPIDWVPTDLAARAVVDLSLSSYHRSTTTVQTFNLVNPHTVSWSFLVPGIQEFYSPTRNIKIIPYTDWVDELKRVSATATDEQIEQMPALKLLDFFEGLNKAPAASTGGEEGKQVDVRFATGHAVAKSKAMAGMGVINGRMMRKWMEEWGF